MFPPSAPSPHRGAAHLVHHEALRQGDAGGGGRTLDDLEAYGGVHLGRVLAEPLDLGDAAAKAQRLGNPAFLALAPPGKEQGLTGPAVARKRTPSPASVFSAKKPPASWRSIPWRGRLRVVRESAAEEAGRVTVSVPAVEDTGTATSRLSVARPSFDSKT